MIPATESTFDIPADEVTSAAAETHLLWSNLQPWRMARRRRSSRPCRAANRHALRADWARTQPAVSAGARRWPCTAPVAEDEHCYIYASGDSELRASRGGCWVR